MESVNFARLEKSLSYREYETARTLYEHFVAMGKNPLEAAALVYRRGVLDGQANARIKAQRNEYHKQKHAAVNAQRLAELESAEMSLPELSPPEAQAVVESTPEEGSNENE